MNSPSVHSPQPAAVVMTNYEKSERLSENVERVKWGVRRERQRACACAFLAVKVPLINLKARNA